MFTTPRLGIAVATAAWLAVAGCSGPVLPPGVGPHPGHDVVETSPFPIRAFAVYLEGYRTMVMPYAGSGNTAQLRGLWLQHDEGVTGWVEVFEPVLAGDGPRSGTLPVCASAREVGACGGLDRETLWLRTDLDLIGNMRRRFFQQDGATRCQCYVVVGLSTDEAWLGEYGPPLPEPELSEEAADGELPVEEDTACADVDQTELPDSEAIVGGVLFRLGTISNEGCSGVHVVDAWSQAIALVPGAKSTSKITAGQSQCRRTDGADLDWVSRQGVEPECHSASDCDDLCPGEDDAQALLQRRGQLSRIDAVSSAGAGDCVCAASVEVSPDNCRSKSDPCGRPLVVRDIHQWNEFWVASEETAAAAADDQRVVVFVGSRSKPFVELPRPPKTAVLGARHHVDARPLFAAQRFAAAPVALVNVPRLRRHDGRESDDSKELAAQCAAFVAAKDWDAAEGACWAGLRVSTEIEERMVVLEQLEGLAIARDRPDRAEHFRRRRDVLRGRLPPP